MKFLYTYVIHFETHRQLAQLIDLLKTGKDLIMNENKKAETNFRKLAKTWDKELGRLFKLNSANSRRTKLFKTAIIVIALIFFVLAIHINNDPIIWLAVLVIGFLLLAIFATRNYVEESAMNNLALIPVNVLQRSFEKFLAQNSVGTPEKKVILEMFLAYRRKETSVQAQNIDKLLSIIIPVATCFVSYLIYLFKAEQLDAGILLVLFLLILVIIEEVYVTSRMFQNLICQLDSKYFKLNLTLKYLDKIESVKPIVRRTPKRC